jgi:SAM-dependent methyltransferase
MKLNGWLDRFCEVWPDAPSLALWRANEAAEFSRVEIRSPSLDLGCGSGFFASEAFPRPFDRGCDISELAVEKARKSDAYRGVDLADGAGLPYEDGFFETVVANCVLEHVLDIDPALKEIQRVLRPGGRLYGTVPTPWFNEWYCLRRFFLEVGLRGAAVRSIDRFNEIQEHWNILPQEEWGRKMRAAGLSLVSVREFLPQRPYAWFSVLDTLWKVHGVQWFMRRLSRFGMAHVFTRFWRASLRRVPNGEGNGAGYFLVGEKA